ncbi:MAG: hypothetical protein QME51_00085 [Planctomycetota bacterium]|nr:hypothetical protein [Planctomycetota bacterium]MDI6786757.1 hypothetical protein [Planctomycetota bacterium]
MQCNKDYDLVSYLNNEISDVEKVEISTHLETCQQCAKELKNISQTISSLRGVPEIEVSDDFTARIISSICVNTEKQGGGLIKKESLINYLRLSPPWAISTAVHLLLFAILTFIFVQQSYKHPVSVNLKDHVSLIIKEPSLSETGVLSPYMSDSDIKMLADKIKLSDDRIVRGVLERADKDKRAELLEEYGGKEITGLISRGLKHLAQTQEENGSWSASKYGGRDEHSVALTGLAVLCFTAEGESHLSGDFRENINKAVRYILSLQQESGLVNSHLTEISMYNHAIATYALLEDYLLAIGLSSQDETENDKLIKELSCAITRAVLFIIEAQSADGGWGYIARSPYPDNIVTTWQIQVLRLSCSLDITGIEQTLYRARSFLNSVTTDGGFVGSRPDAGDALTGMASGMNAYLWLNSLPSIRDSNDIIKKRWDEIITRQVAILEQNLPLLESGEADLYYWFWGAQAMLSTPDDDKERWNKWNARIKETLARGISEDGSWQTPPDRWRVYGGELYTTTMALLTLQVYYRYPPLR